MATISGRVIFDRDRSASVTGGDSGLAAIPVVLQNINTNERLVVLTDSAGNYSFINVPDGEYRIVESYGTTGGVPSPGDFSLAVAGSIPPGVNPPVSAAANPPPGTTNLDSVTPDTVFITVSGANLSNLNFLNGPVIYTPIQTILDPCAVVSGDNLIDDADRGTFGSFPPGTPANTGVPTEPYPGVTPDFVYVLPNPDTYTPSGGQYTVQNIMNNALSQVIGAWWRIADHTEGNETGRMMVINGDNPGAVFFRSVVMVKPDTNYLFTAWILNLFKVTGYPDPQLGVRVLDENNNVLYSAALGTLIPPNGNAPEWKEVGSVINSRGNTRLTVEFISEGPEVIGNDYAIDDISFHEIQVPLFVPVKTADRQTVDVGETVRFTVTLTNTCQSPLTSLFFQDEVPNGLSFVPGSVTVNGIPEPAFSPIPGFPLPDVPGGTAVTVAFDALAEAVPVPNPALNYASIDYSYTPVEGGIPGVYHVVSNEVPVEITVLADLSVVKTAEPNPVGPGNTLTYTIKVTNQGPSPADNVLLTDLVPDAFIGAEYSIDNGVTFLPWTGTLSLGTLAPGDAASILIRGLVHSSASGILSNTATVSSTTPDPDPSNNTDSADTVIVNGVSADLSITKLAEPAAAVIGESVLYTITVANHGPSPAEDVFLYDEVSPDLTDVEFSTDGGAFWNPWVNPYGLGSLAPGESVVLLIRGTAAATACGTLTNTAVVTSSTPDPDPNNNTASTIIPVQGGADLSILKTACPNPAVRGQWITFTLTVSNTGPETAAQAVITDILPPEVLRPLFSLDQGRTWCPWTGSHTLYGLPSGGTVRILIRGMVDACAPPCFVNKASVSSSAPDPCPCNNTSCVTVQLMDPCCCCRQKGCCREDEDFW